MGDISDLDVEDIASEFLLSIGNFNSRSSQWVVDHIIDFRVTLAPFRPAQGSSFLPTPSEIAVKKAVVNVQNYNDELCFLYSILAALHPVQHRQNLSRVSHYKPYLSELDVTGLSFPLSVRDVSKFESLNADIAVNVMTFDERQPIPLYVSPHRDRKHNVHLLLLADENTQHYTLVKNLSRLDPNITEEHSYAHTAFTVSRKSTFSTPIYPTAVPTPHIPL